MKITLATPALFFSAISLLMLAFTNRFIALAQLVRSLKDRHKESPSKLFVGQIDNLRSRLNMIRNMQIYGISSLFLCVLSMFLIYMDRIRIAELIFGLAILLLMISLAISIREIIISVRALNIHLSDIEDDNQN